MSSDFTIEICGDLDFEGMVVDISYKMETIASINYEKGVDQMEIEIHNKRECPGKFTFPLKDFFDALERAKTIALKCAAEDDLKR